MTKKIKRGARTQRSVAMSVYVTPENRNYVKSVGKKTGASITAVVNALINTHRSKRYAIAAEIRKNG